MGETEILLLPEVLQGKRRKTAKSATIQEIAKRVMAGEKLSTLIQAIGLIVILAIKITRMQKIPTKRENVTLAAGKENCSRRLSATQAASISCS